MKVPTSRPPCQEINKGAEASFLLFAVTPHAHYGNVILLVRLFFLTTPQNCHARGSEPPEGTSEVGEATSEVGEATSEVAV